ncbi:MAG: hypothetical protein WD036_04925 [Bauldia sp.]
MPSSGGWPQPAPEPEPPFAAAAQRLVAVDLAARVRPGRWLMVARPLVKCSRIRRVYGSDDFKRGVRTFLDKKTPDWTGR